MSADLAPFLAANAVWAKNVTAAQPTFFTELAKAQHPPMVWVGCSDSRVPESTVMDQMPGQVFTHRNIANQVQPDEPNAGAVIEYAVLHLNVTNVVIVGHTGCGGATAAHNAALAAANSTTGSTDKPHGKDHGKDHGKGKGHGKGHGHGHGHNETAPASLLDEFLGPLIDLQVEIGLDKTIDQLIVANVKRSVENIAESDYIKQAWESGFNVSIHGWLYNLSSGLLTDLNMTHYNNHHNIA